VQGRPYQLIDYLTQKPNIGTNRYLLSHPEIYKTYKALYGDYRKHGELLNLLTYKLKNATAIIQDIRNKASHQGSISRQECDKIRNLLLGIGEESILVLLLKRVEWF